MPRFKRRLLLWSVVLLMAALGIVLLPKWSLFQRPGYVFIGWGEWQIETTTVALILTILFAFLLLYSAIRLVVLILRWPQRRRVQRLERIHSDMVAGLEALARGAFDEAENHFLAAAAREPRWIYYLYAARAAHLRGSYRERNELLQKVRQENEAAALLAEARWALEADNLHHALLAIDRFLSQFEATPHALKLAYRIYRATGRTEALEKLKPQLDQFRDEIEAPPEAENSPTESA